MKILVCISHVPDTTSKINFIENNSKFDKNGVQFIINPNDEFGLTRAIWFKEKNNASVDVINVGLQETEATLRKALAIGADKAIRINIEPKDSSVVAKSISDYISNNNYDLIIAGRESIDYNGGMVPGMISALTKINFIHIDVDTYETTKYILETLKPFLVKNSIILFDEIYDVPGWKMGELKGLQEVFNENEYKFIAFGKDGGQAVIKII